MRIGLASDHGGFGLKEELAARLRAVDHEIVDFGANSLNPDDDYPDFVIPLARAVAAGQVERGLAICGSGVGACVCANKIAGVRAALIEDHFSARQGVEDDHLNVLCLGGRTEGVAVAWDLVETFLAARYSQAERHLRRLAKVAALEPAHQQKDPQVGLIFSHNLARYVATGVDPNDAQRLMARIERWEDWCRLWSEEAARHEALAKEAADKGRAVSAAEAYVRAAIYYHYGKHLFADHADEWRTAHDSVVRCYAAGAPGLDPPLQRLTFPYQSVEMPGWLRKPRESARPPVAILLPGLDACKEELHAWAVAFVARGVAALTIDGPGQGETSLHLPVTYEWGRVIGAVIDVLERRDDVDARRVGVVGQSLGAIYAPLAAAGEPRLKACIANCGPYDAGRLLSKLPPLHQEVFRAGAHARTAEEAQQVADKITLVGVAERITCPLLVVVGADDKLVPPSEGELLAKTASGPTELVVYPEGNHVCFNISYKFRPLTADWMAERLGAGQA